MAFVCTQYQNAEEAAQCLADLVAKQIEQFLQKQERVTLAVSGGRSPIAFFQALSQKELAWDRVNIALVDERMVPTHHTDSNTRLVREHLLCHHAQAAKWLPMIDDEANESDLHNTEQAVAFALSHFIAPDIAVLGMGNDGHTASLFPQAPQYADGIRADYALPLLHTTPITAPHERISMSLSALERVPQLYLAIGGAEKWAVYQQAQAGKQAVLPISYVLHSEKANTHVIFHS